ncbi:MAG: hypothetical protein JSU92_10435 [Deltaproteobacteria bacterium]|nr:MAG: hypothetical protein JSU92_10435 [Deltaproteobacteria bacterium]
MEIAVTFIKWVVIVGVAYLVLKMVYTLIAKPNLRYYLWKTIKDTRYMYSRYHV